MKLYTRQGDDGTTRLFGGTQVGKDDARVIAYGEVDELNSAIGVARAACDFGEVDAILRDVQNELFDVGADLSTPAGNNAAEQHIRRVGPDDAARLESAIDRTCAPLPPMKQFILPGGSELASRLHLARAICRRAERASVTLARGEQSVGHVIIYLNRLSDLLFALARRANQLAGVDDVPWRKRG